MRKQDIKKLALISEGLDRLSEIACNYPNFPKIASWGASIIDFALDPAAELCLVQKDDVLEKIERHIREAIIALGYSRIPSDRELMEKYLQQLVANIARGDKTTDVEIRVIESLIKKLGYPERYCELAHIAHILSECELLGLIREELIAEIRELAVKLTNKIGGGPD